MIFSARRLHDTSTSNLKYSAAFQSFLAFGAVRSGGWCSSVLAPAVCLTALASVPAAHAQVIDQYLNPNIPGYGIDPGVTVTSRVRPEYDPTGVRLGNFIITPVLSESIGYDDNVTGTPAPHGSVLIQTNASLSANATWSDTSFAASAMVDNLEYPQQTGQSYTNWSIAAGASHNFGRDTLYVGYTHLNLNQTSRGLASPDLDTAIGYRVDDVRSTYKLDLGHAYLQPGIDFAHYGFDNGFANGQGYQQSYRDRFLFAPSLEAGYEFATRRRVVVILRDTQADYTRAPPGQPRQNFNDFSALAGVVYDADGVIGFRLLGGYEERTFPSSLYQMIQAPILEGAITWTPTGLTTITATAARYIEDSASEVTVGFTETALALKLDEEVFRNVIVTGHAGLFLDDYDKSATSTGGSQSFYTAGVGVSWLLNRKIRLAADYTFAERHSDDATNSGAFETTSTGIFGTNYSENTFRLTIRFAL